jgi:hypothetical protein
MSRQKSIDRRRKAKERQRASASPSSNSDGGSSSTNRLDVATDLGDGRMETPQQTLDRAKEMNAGMSSGGVSTIEQGSPVVSSEDAEGEFNQISSELDNRDNDITTDTGTGGSGGGASGTGGAGGETTGADTGDVIYDGYINSLTRNAEAGETWRQEQEDLINDLLPKTLASIDAQYKSSKMNIEATYRKLIDSQIRINQIDSARVSAYGVQNGGQYMPLEFTKAISRQEQKNANELGKLNSERDALIARAKADRDEGRIGAMRENLEDIRALEEEMRDRVNQLNKDVEARYELTLEAREKKEKEHLEQVNKALAKASLMYLDDFSEADDPEAIDKIIKGIIKDSGGILTPDDYYGIYSTLSGASAEAQKAQNEATKDQLDIQKKQADIANVYDTINKRANNNEKGENGNVYAGLNEFFSMQNTDDFTIVDDSGNPYKDRDGNVVTSVVGKDGKAHPELFKDAMNEAKENEVKKEEFLAEYGYLVNLDHYQDYGLTEKDKDIIEGLD